MPTRNTRPATQTHSRVVSRTTSTPATGCQRGISGAAAIRSTISIGVAGGKKDMPRAKALVGSRTTFMPTNIGMQPSRMTGMSELWASFISLQAAPMAMNIEPYMMMARA